MGKTATDDYRYTENAIEWLSGERYATITVSQKKWIDLITHIAKAKKLKKIIINTDGTVTARIPIEWVKLMPKEDNG